ncbi:hypothetical protein [Vibrio sp. M260112]|uniref:hypothetical protein n=1 Tax=Vibrio sp. M260112 TaxID=3020895 RepID=UPI002F42546F
MNVTNIINSVVNYKRSKRLLSMGIKGYLSDIGWLKSLELGVPVDSNGEPVPWVTYPFIDFISERLKDTHRIFEFGSGNSTNFYSARASFVHAVEHDEKWVEYLRRNNFLKGNVSLQHVSLEDGYSRSFEKRSDTGTFDLIIVDGRERVSCIKSVISLVNECAVIVLDDSERERYKDAIEALTKANYKQLDFYGLAPNVTYKKCTSVFYKKNNCLNI